MDQNDIRRRVSEHTHLLAHPAEQLDYERNVPIADVPSELIAMFCNDLFHPKDQDFIGAFTEEELKGLAHLYGLLVEAARSEVSSVSELLKLPAWRTVLEHAKQLDDHYSRLR